MVKEKQKCPKCNSKLFHKYGKSPAGSQRFLCGDCGKSYIPNPKHKGYSEEIKQQAIKMHFAGSSGRTVGKVMGFSKANIYNWAKKNSASVDK